MAHWSLDMWYLNKLIVLSRAGHFPMNLVALLTFAFLPFLLAMDKKVQDHKSLTNPDLFTTCILSGIRYNFANVQEFIEPLIQSNIEISALTEELECLKGPVLPEGEDVVVNGYSFLHYYRLWKAAVYRGEEAHLTKLLNETFANDPDVHVLLAAFHLEQFEPSFVYNLDDMLLRMQYQVRFLDEGNANPRSYNILLGMTVGQRISFPFFRLLVSSKNVDAKTMELLYKRRFNFHLNPEQVDQLIKDERHDAMITEQINKTNFASIFTLFNCIKQNRPSEIIMLICSLVPVIFDIIFVEALKKKYDEQVIKQLAGKMPSNGLTAGHIEVARNNGYSDEFIKHLKTLI